MCSAPQQRAAAIRRHIYAQYMRAWTTACQVTSLSVRGFSVVERTSGDEGEMPELSGRVALVTGAGRGQGRSHAVGLAAAGADVAICDVCAPISGVPYDLASEDDLTATRGLVESEGRRCVSAVADVRDAVALERFSREAVARLGRIDVLVANAGVAGVGAPLDIAAEEWNAMLDVNLTGVWNSVRAVVPHMIRGGEGGSIIITSSIAALQAMGGTAHYAASKAGVIGLTRALAKDLGQYSIRVNTVAPSVVETPMVMDNPALLAWMQTQPQPASKHLLPVQAMDVGDITNAVVWLASPQARYVTGVTIPVDAGHSID